MRRPPAAWSLCCVTALALQGRTVIVVDKPAQRLFVGQPVFVVVDSTGARWGRVQSLRDDAEVQELSANADAPEGVGVGLDFKFPKSAEAKLVVLTAEDDVVWSPTKVATAAAKRATVNAG